MGNYPLPTSQPPKFTLKPAESTQGGDYKISILGLSKLCKKFGDGRIKDAHDKRK
jgi:hypothetical protein